MAVLTVPEDQTLYPTLGPQICDFIERNLVFGPGDLRGRPAVIDDEKTALIYRMYEVFPRGHALAGRRRFKRCAISLRKGTAKTEFAAWIAGVELHRDGPVRCVGWTESGEPIGGPVSDPYIPLVAYTEEQSEELAYGALRVILENSPIRDDFDIGLERILRLDRKGKEAGKAVALATAPDARDGARTTFQHFDETHRFTLGKLRRAHQAMLANIPKRMAADAWSFETTTAFEPGTGSVAEATMEYALQIKAGKIPDARMFYFHREAGAEHDLSTDEGLMAAIAEASGPAAGWSDLSSIAEQYRDPTTDKPYFERVWLNRLVQSSTQAFDVTIWSKLARPERERKTGRPITIGLDGSQFHDSTSIVCTDIADAFQWMEGLWECPFGQLTWEVPTKDVDATVRTLFAEFSVWRMYADPAYWQSWIAQWQSDLGKERVNEWWTNRPVQMARALEGFDTAYKTGLLTHDGNADLQRHVGNARRKNLRHRDEQGKPLWVIQKERSDSPHKIDAAMAAVLSWEARTDAVAAGVLNTAEPAYQVYVYGGRRR